VALWLYPAPVALDRRQSAADPTPAEHREGSKSADATDRRRQAQREDMPDGRNGLILPFRAESLLSFAEYVKVNRGHEDGDDEDPARAAPTWTASRWPRTARDTASRVRFDLDLPSAAHDDIPAKRHPAARVGLEEAGAQARHVQPHRARPGNAQPCELPPHLLRPARRLRHQFEALTPARRWLKNQPEGPELDIDACVRAFADRRTGHVAGSDGGYLSCERRERDLCCLVLADLSLSTDTWVSDEQRVIDVIRDSLWLFSEALGPPATPSACTASRHASASTSAFTASRASTRSRRPHPRPHRRPQAGLLHPHGAAIRYATQILAKRPEALRC
jgi:nitric oxide reductase NorD protein